MRGLVIGMLLIFQSLNGCQAAKASIKPLPYEQIAVVDSSRVSGVVVR